MPPKRTRRIALMGFRAVGKSTITIQFVENHFADQYTPTIENTYAKRFKHNQFDYEMEIIDTSGQDEFSVFQKQYAIGIHAYVLVYCVNSLHSFEMVKVINDKILNAVGADSVPRVLVGNKADLGSERVVSEEEGKALAKQWGCPFVECSAKTNDHISEIFLACLDDVDQHNTSVPPKKEKESSCVLC